MAVVVKNRSAYHEYFIEDTYEAGLVLVGTEIKAIRSGKVQLKEAFITFIDGEAFIKNMHVAEFEQGNRFNHDPLRERKLLLHRHEIVALERAVQTKGFTIVPLQMYLVRGRAKLQIGVAKGKHLYDKRQVEKERSMQREIDRAIKYRD